MPILRLGERTVVRSDGGLLAAEYALFDGGDIVLQASDPVSVRETGYRTTAGEALDRLAHAGARPELAELAARSISPDVVSSFARGAAARSVSAQLWAQELFDGAIFRSQPSRYEGAWLDLAALSEQLAMPAAPILLQVLHLASSLAEVPGDTPVVLTTFPVTQDRRPGERTYSRLNLDGLQRVPDALARLAPRRHTPDATRDHDRRMRRALVARIQERIGPDAPEALRTHLDALHTALAPRTMDLDPLSDPLLQRIERRLATGDTTGIEHELAEVERRRGPGPAIRYLRTRAALLRLAEDPSATDAERLAALEILDRRTPSPNDAPRTAYGDLASAPPAPPPWTEAASNGIDGQLFGAPPPPMDDPPIVDDTMPDRRDPARDFHAYPSYAPNTPPPPWAWPHDSAGGGRPQGSSRPPPMRYEAEILETLPLPYGMSESALGAHETPLVPLQARIAMTRLARDVGRDYRSWYGKVLRCNVLAVDAIQEHLAARFLGAASLADEMAAWELLRHGAVLSEIIARALGGAWVDIGPSEPGYWAMVVPPGIRVWPVGRVHRFVAMGHRARDLVGYYLELEAKVRSADH